MATISRFDELETLNEQIRLAELRIARCGDEWLTRVQRQELTMMYQRRKTLMTGQTNG